MWTEKQYKADQSQGCESETLISSQSTSLNSISV